MHSVLVELLKAKSAPPLFFAKATLLVILSRQNARLQILLFEVRFLKRRGPAAEGKAVGLSLKLEVDLRRKSLEHAMHPARRRRILRASPSAAGPLTVTDAEGKAFSGAFEVSLKCI